MEFKIQIINGEGNALKIQNQISLPFKEDLSLSALNTLSASEGG